MKILQIAFLLVIIASSALAESTKRILVLEFKHPGSFNQQSVLFLTDRIRGQAIVLAGHGYKVMTRENIIELLPPGTNLEDCVGDCEVDVGRKVQASYVVSGQIIKLGLQVKLMLTLHETKTGTIINGKTYTAASVAELDEKIAKDKSDIFQPLKSGLLLTDKFDISSHSPSMMLPEMVQCYFKNDALYRTHAQRKALRAKVKIRSKLDAVQGKIAVELLQGGFQEFLRKLDLDVKKFRSSQAQWEKTGRRGVKPTLTLNNAEPIRVELGGDIWKIQHSTKATQFERNYLYAMTDSMASTGNYRAFIQWHKGDKQVGDAHFFMAHKEFKETRWPQHTIPRAKEHLTKAFEVGDFELRGWAYYLQAWIAMQEKQYPKALQDFKEALKLSKDRCGKTLEAATLNDMKYAFIGTNKLQEAKDFYTLMKKPQYYSQIKAILGS